MHEAAIASHLLAEVLSHAEQHDADQIIRIILEIGEFELIVPEALETAFAMSAEGTIADGAELVMSEVPAVATCRPCGQVFKPDIACYLCPACGAADAELTAGRGIVLRSLELS